MLTTKSKIHESKLSVYDRLKEMHFEDGAAVARGAIAEGHLRQAITVVYSVLINHSVTIMTKFNALAFLKGAFQTGILYNHTAQRQVLIELERVLPVIADIARFRKHPPNEDYFASRQHRWDSNVETSDRYVGMCKELLKHWSNCMTDVGLAQSIYCQEAAHLSGRFRSHLPQHFSILTFDDYLQFLSNWNKENRPSLRFDEKLAIYEFLTNEGTYNDKLPLYKEKLMSYPDEITEQCYGLLISSSIPFPSKMLVLCALRDLYSENNQFFCKKVDRDILPYFQYVIRKILQDPTLRHRFLEKTEKRSEIQHNSSAVYLTAVMRAVMEFCGYNGQSDSNVYRELAQSIKHNGLLPPDESGPKPMELEKQFFQKRKIGVHREHEYQAEEHLPETKIVTFKLSEEEPSPEKELTTLRATVKESKKKELQMQQIINSLQQQLAQSKRQRSPAPHRESEEATISILDTNDKQTCRDSFPREDEKEIFMPPNRKSENILIEDQGPPSIVPPLIKQIISDNFN